MGVGDYISRNVIYNDNYNNNDKLIFFDPMYCEHLKSVAQEKMITNSINKNIGYCNFNVINGNKDYFLYKVEYLFDDNDVTENNYLFFKHFLLYIENAINLRNFVKKIKDLIRK